MSYGFASGGSDICSKKDNSAPKFGGGSGAGVSINPVGFLVVSKGDVKFVSIDKYDGPADRIVGMVPEMFDKVKGVFSKEKKKNPEVGDDEIL